MHGDPEDPAVDARFEATVSEIATAAVARLRRGAPVGLVVGSVVVPPVREPRQAGRLLRPLAEVQMMPIDTAGPADLHGKPFVGFSAEDRG